MKRVEMHVLPAVYVPCEVCHGRRFNEATLAVPARPQQHLRSADHDLLACTRSRLPEDTTILLLFLAAVVWNLVAASVGWSHAISDWYGWRQTQTAIAAYFMQQGGPWIDYQVPILGPPWQLPHEFPLYQALVVTLGVASGLPLEAAGRTVSLAFVDLIHRIMYLK